MHRHQLTFVSCLVWLGLALTLGGCEENVNPFIEGAERNFTMFGALDMNADSQFVRVTPIRRDVEFDESDPIDATFVSHNVTDGTSITWQDSLFTFEDGSQGHVFVAPLRIQPGHTYRIEVTRSADGAVSSAETTVPSLPVPVVDPIVISQGSLLVSQSVRWIGVESDPFNVETFYRFLPTQGSQFIDVPIEYPSRNNAPDIGNGWQFIVDMTNDKEKVVDVVPNPDQFTFMGMGMGITVLDDQFDPPGGRFDPEILVQPGVFSNVEDGFGFVGAMGRFTVEWIIPDEAITNLGYVPPRAEP